MSDALQPAHSLRLVAPPCCVAETQRVAFAHHRVWGMVVVPAFRAS